MRELLNETLRDYKARQDAGEHMMCPRCGRDAMDPSIHRNALSRYADVHVCDDCGTAEAMLDLMKNPLPPTQWACVRSERPRADFEVLPGGAVLERLRKEQLPYLTGLYERWLAEPKGADFEAYRLEAHRHCAGLTALWNQPFQAVYRVLDGQLLIRFRTTEKGTEVATDLIPKP
jgi:predicted RNA-binding Zn-ribbon protein involved in translation (DUF1610 family)